MEKETMLTNRQSRIALIALGGVVLVAIVVAGVLSARQKVAELDPNSPEGTVQAYVQAIFDRDEAAALEYLTPELQRECQKRDFPISETSALRVQLDDVSITDADARVEVTIHESHAPLEEWQHTEIFHLTDTENGWRISRYPWPVYGC